METSANLNDPKIQWHNLDNWGRPLHRIEKSFSWATVNKVSDLTPLFKLGFLPVQNYEVVRKKASAQFLTGCAALFLVYALLATCVIYPATENLLVFRVGICSAALSGICLTIAFLYAGIYRKTLNTELSTEQKTEYQALLYKDFNFVRKTITTFEDAFETHKNALPDLKQKLTEQGIL